MFRLVGKFEERSLVTHRSKYERAGIIRSINNIRNVRYSEAEDPAPPPEKSLQQLDILALQLEIIAKTSTSLSVRFS